MERLRLSQEHRTKSLVWELFKSRCHYKFRGVTSNPGMARWEGNTWLFTSFSSLTHFNFFGYLYLETFLVLVYKRIYCCGKAKLQRLEAFTVFQHSYVSRKVRCAALSQGSCQSGTRSVNLIICVFKCFIQPESQRLKKAFFILHCVQSQ